MVTGQSPTTRTLNVAALVEERWPAALIEADRFAEYKPPLPEPRAMTIWDRLNGQALMAELLDAEVNWTQRHPRTATKLDNQRRKSRARARAQQAARAS